MTDRDTQRLLLKISTIEELLRKLIKIIEDDINDVNDKEYKQF